MALTGATLAQIGQGAVVVAVIASVTVMVVAGKIDAVAGLSVILGAVGMGSGATIGVHASSVVAATQAPPAVTPEVPDVPHVVG